MKKLVLIVVVAMLMGGCVYYNTFYHAKKFFNTAESSRKKDKRDTARGAELTNYQDAIKKSSKVLSEYPGSKYEDDALFLIGKSFYYLGEYQKAERKFRELLSSFPESKYAEESRFFLGKTRFRMENYRQAAETLEKFVGAEKGNRWRAEALYFLGELYYTQELHDQALDYFRRFKAEYNSDHRMAEVNSKLGEIFREQDMPDSAIVAFAAAAAATELVADKFGPLYDLGISLYQADSLDAGMRKRVKLIVPEATSNPHETGIMLFKRMLEGDEYAQKQADIRLRLAEGEYLNGDVQQSVRQYDEITSDFLNTEAEAEAYYNLGLIVQDDFDDMETAKEMYDFAARVNRGGDFRQMAIERSANIAKVEQYRVNLDSDDIEEVIKGQFLLAELYRLTLNRPDSAMSVYRNLVRQFPGSDLAPRSLLAMGWLYENHYEDSAAAEETYRSVIEEYPYSDEYADALEILGLLGTEYDSVYSEKLYRMAEQQYHEQGNPDSALVLLKRLKSRYRDSQLVPKAEFTMAKIELQQFVPRKAPPGDSTFVDSTMIWRFQSLSRKYADLDIGKEAARLAAGESKERPKPRRQQQQRPETADTGAVFANEDSDSEPGDTLSEAQLQEQRIQQILEELPLAPEKPTLEPEFNYPYSAYGEAWEGKIMTRIKIEFDGAVTEVELLKPSPNEDINKEVERVLLLTEFNQMEIEALDIGGFFIYYYQVIAPEEIRRLRE